MIYTVDQIADYLVSGFWASRNEPPHKFAGNTISVNLAQASDVGLARMALETWASVANLQFVEVTGAAQITFTGLGDQTVLGRTTTSHVDGTTTSAVVKITSGYITKNGSDRNTRSYEAYLHEIGHALGLGHGGPYDTAAVYGLPQSTGTNIYDNDTVQFSVMSYFRQNNFAGSSDLWAMTPQVADIVAIQRLYGAPNTRAGDTVYGFGSTAGPLYDFSSYVRLPALTIYDSAGLDTLDASQFANNQWINLAAGGFSSIGGLVNNIAIATNTVIENARGGIGADTILGNNVANTLTGGGANDRLLGYDGADVLQGDAGDDGLEGGAGSDRLFGGNGNDVLDGGDDADDMDGGAGDDAFRLGRGNDAINGGTGIDLLSWSQTGVFLGEPRATALTLDLAAETASISFDAETFQVSVRNVENVDGLFFYANIISGSEDSNRIVAGVKDDILDGRGGDDFLDGQDGADRIYGGNGNDTIFGGDGFDHIYGGAGNDQLFGGNGTDAVYGESGNDTIVWRSGMITADGGAGTDTLVLLEAASVDLRAPNQVVGPGPVFSFVTGFEIVNADFSDASAAVSFSATQGGNFITASVFNDDISGLAGNDVIYGGAGNDNLRGNNGADELHGDAGDDILNGGGGANVLLGGVGNDTYVVGSSGANAIVELADEGIDIVKSAATLTLDDNVERLTLVGGSTIDGFGNGLANRISGNGAANVLDGMSGNDILTGGGGADTFRFSTALTANVDRITDFDSNEDIVLLSRDIFSSLHLGGLTEADFDIVGDARARDVTDRMIFNPASGVLFYDADGRGGAAAVQVAIFAKATALGADDFLVM